MMPSTLAIEVSDPVQTQTQEDVPATNSEWAPLPIPLQAKLTQLQNLTRTAQELSQAVEAAQRPRVVADAPNGEGELENIRPFTHRIVHRKIVNERELAFAREEVRLLLCELDQAARDQLCANRGLKDRVRELIAADPTEMAAWEGARTNWSFWR